MTNPNLLDAIKHNAAVYANADKASKKNALTDAVSTEGAFMALAVSVSEALAKGESLADVGIAAGMADGYVRNYDFIGRIVSASGDLPAGYQFRAHRATRAGGKGSSYQLSYAGNPVLVVGPGKDEVLDIVSVQTLVANALQGKGATDNVRRVFRTGGDKATLIKGIAALGRAAAKKAQPEPVVKPLDEQMATIGKKIADLCEIKWQTVGDGDAIRETVSKMVTDLKFLVELTDKVAPAKDDEDDKSK